jgi:hypothetical protein
MNDFRVVYKVEGRVYTHSLKASNAREAKSMTINHAKWDDAQAKVKIISVSASKKVS